MIELVHTLSRGVDKRKIFLDDGDRLRFVHNLFEFNNESNANNNLYSFKNNDIASHYIRKSRKLLVKIHSFCLMDNHYHLLLSANKENGIPMFMKKLNIGYAKYFNARYERTGTLFEGRYKSVPVKNEAHFIHIPYYIHLNPLDFISSKWRNGEISSQSLKFLNNYRWSSHFDYTGRKNFPSVTDRSFLLDFFGGVDGYKKSMGDWINERRGQQGINDGEDNKIDSD